MAPIAAFAGLDLPQLATPDALADWLLLPPGRLDYLSDRASRHERHGDFAVNHYSCVLHRKTGGGLRLVEAPKPTLKALQRQVLRRILDKVPPHGDAFGFVRGRSCRDGARRHAGEQMVLCFDLKDFFPSIGAGRVFGLFRCLRYPEAAARHLTGLCTTATPARVTARLPAADRPLYRRAHLPQGAPGAGAGQPGGIRAGPAAVGAGAAAGRAVRPLCRRPGVLGRPRHRRAAAAPGARDHPRRGLRAAPGQDPDHVAKRAAGGDRCGGEPAPEREPPAVRPAQGCDPRLRRTAARSGRGRRAGRRDRLGRDAQPGARRETAAAAGAGAGADLTPAHGCAPAADRPPPCGFRSTSPPQARARRRRAARRVSTPGPPPRAGARTSATC
ncbi:hypothetical protein GE300_17330 [Rhodobacteraceae bacterium 2CG4]|uniref:Uncharacterized protein n=1 Tax=Halovulum marinum TaxID=2662447 RepID=A0A6L5Z469_9RHOB|nr:hypothetical protein [Halovulum marinum]